MDVVLLLLTTGLCAVSSHAEHRRYYLVSDLKTWSEAQSYCREKYTDLAIIDNMDDVKILNNMANERQMGNLDAWIGLYDDVNSWRWSLSNRSFYQHGETEFRQWGPGQPNEMASEQVCVTMLKEWMDTKCNLHYRAACSDVKGQNVTFVLTDTLMTWTEAQNFCREHYTDLASVRNEAENQKLQQMTAVQYFIWIGLFRDTWKWTNGRKPSFTYWEGGEPNDFTEACVAVSFERSGQWQDWNCARKIASVCYIEKVHKQVIKVRFERKNSSLDPNDPAVMEATLKELKQKLKDQGMNYDIKLSWKKQSDGKVFHKEEKKNKKKTHDEI